MKTTIWCCMLVLVITGTQAQQFPSPGWVTNPHPEQAGWDTAAFVHREREGSKTTSRVRIPDG